MGYLGVGGLSYRRAVDMMIAEEEAEMVLRMTVDPEHVDDVLADVDALAADLDERNVRGLFRPNATPRCEALDAFATLYAKGQHRTQESTT